MAAPPPIPTDSRPYFDGTVNGTALDSGYVPGKLDEISADAADGMIYSFYGRLSVGITDVDLLRSGELPPTFYCYGTCDPFYSQFLTNADAEKRWACPWNGSNWTICPTASARGAVGSMTMTAG